ncbi:DMT family transporter [Halospeciosus flavus]|uniref:DMT family transporter n=1 Tax=Halospeciosus flavus TaxID=3032283 RepID=A0ABD5Z4P7_9EURY|nr:EamA family transporter [Halospeciosus flavus]
MADRRDVVLFLTLAFLWGSAFVAIKFGLNYFPPVLYAALRYEFGGLVVLAYAAATCERWVPRGWADAQQILVRAVLIFAVFHALLFLGQQYVPSAIAAILVAMNPVLTAGFSRVLLPEEDITVRDAAGLLCGLAGVVVLVGPDVAGLGGLGGLGGGESGGLRGPLLVFGGVVAIALGSTLAERLDQRLDARPLTGWSMFLGALLIHVGSLASGESLAAVQWTPLSIAALLYIAILPGAAGFICYFELLDSLVPYKVNLVNYVVPVVATVFGWVLLGEVLGPEALVGFLVILLGFSLLHWRQVRGYVG